MHKKTKGGDGGAGVASLYDFFSPGGVLSKSELQFEFRRGQYQMAQAVEAALGEGRHLIVEAGTGTGKTLAYLLPALRRARERGERIIVSTGTKNLQEQIVGKDVPFLESLLGPMRVCTMKGRANYLCRSKLYALRDQPLLSGLEEIDQFHQIAKWEKETETGDRAEVAGLPESSALWAKLDARTEACLGQRCPEYERCFVTEMRRKALASEIVVINHHLFFADMALRQNSRAPDAGVLPEAGAVIFDEAHELEDIASAYFGVGLSSRRVEEMARDAEALLRAKHSYGGKVEAATNALRERARAFFAALPAGETAGRVPFANRKEFLEECGDLYLSVTSALQRLEGELKRVKDVEEAKGLAERAEDIRAQLEFLIEGEDQNVVFWIERRAMGGLKAAARGAGAGGHHTHLQATPIDISELLKQTLFTVYPSVVLTSATLTVESGFQHVRSRLGLEHARELMVASHFDYARQALLYLPTGIPEPKLPEFLPKATERVRRVLELTRGRAFCLFTSRRVMHEMYERLLGELPFPLLLQGSKPRQALLEEFRRTPNAVLFGAASFWHGVDVQGEQLSCVIVDRLPFDVPSDPVVEARGKAINEAGGRAFYDYTVPSAVITLKQGFGRLIRSLTDRGVLVLLDSRIQTKSYGRIFLESLPPYRLTQDITEVEAFFAEENVGKA